MTARSADTRLDKKTIKQKKVRFMEEITPHLNSLYRSAYFMVDNMFDSEDLVQDTLLASFRSFHTYRSGTNARAWLMKIMRNLFIDWMRRKQRAVKTVTLPEAFENNISYEEMLKQGLEDPEFQALVNVLPENLEKALKQLPEDFRTALTLCDIEGMTYLEIAEVMDCPLGTVSSRIFRARKIVRVLIEKNSAQQKGRSR